jgi:hypothetical protein
MIESKQILANLSEGENPGGFAKVSTTLKNQYFLISFVSKKYSVMVFWMPNLTLQKRFAKMEPGISSQ